MRSLKIMSIIFGGLLLFACNNGSENSGFTGILEGTDVQVPALVGGKILHVAVSTGDEIAKGQLIAVIDTAELVLQKQQLQGALDEIAAQQKIVETTVAQAAKDFAYINEKTERTKLLLDKKSVARQQYDDVLNAGSKISSALISAKQNRQTLAAKAKQMNARIGLLNKKITDARIESPISGTVASKYYESGEAAMPMSPVVEVIALDPIEVKIFVSETRLAGIKIGQQVTLKVDGTDQDFSGKVIWISPKAEFTPKNIMTEETRTSLVYAVKVQAANPDGVLKHGMPVVVHL